jgi:uncharacterized protein
MRSILKYMVLIVLLFSCHAALLAQLKQPEYTEKKPSVAVIARSKGDSVWVRWAPDDPLLWQAANKYGYRVVRTKVAEDDRLLFGEARITLVVADSIRPFSIEEIEPYIETDQYTAIVGQAIYGDDFDVSASFDNNPSQIIQRARELEDRFSFALFSADQSPLAARVHGLWFTDSNVDLHDKYLYMVYPLIPPGVMEFDTAFTVIAVNDTAQLPKPFDFRGSFGDKFVELVWNREYLQPFYTSYRVERSDDNGHTYKSTTGSPFLNSSENPDEQSEFFYRVDSLPENGKEYSFRIRGISPFGETGPPSDVVSGMGMGKAEFINPVITRHEIINDAAVKIEWEVMEEYSSEITGFEVSKAANSNGPFTSLTPDLLDRQLRSFTDLQPLKSGFYRIASVDRAGERHYSFPAMVLLPDSLPPAMPANLKGTVDSTGIVTLMWDAVSDADLAGYRIYRSNHPDDGYMKINNGQIMATTFTDTLSLRVLTKNVYYKLAAIDKHYNESELTTALIIERPDTIAPAPPAFYNYAVTDSSVILYWHNSASVDVNDHMLYRRKTGETEWTRINQSGDTTGWYNDMDVINQTVYQYLIIAADKSGLESEPGQTMDVRASGTLKPVTVITKLNAKADNSGKRVVVTWEPVKGQMVVKYAVYRSVNDGLPVLYKTVVGTEKSFTDSNVSISNSYTYRLQAFLNNGGKSPLSEGVKVSY